MSDRIVNFISFALAFRVRFLRSGSNYLLVVKTSSQEEGASRREWLLVYLVSQTLKPVNDLFLYSAFLSIKYSSFDLLFTHVSGLRRCLGSFRLIQIIRIRSELTFHAKNSFFRRTWIWFYKWRFQHGGTEARGAGESAQTFPMNFVNRGDCLYTRIMDFRSLYYLNFV